MKRNEEKIYFMNKKQLLAVFHYNIQLIYKTYTNLSLTKLANKLNIPSSTLSRFIDEKNDILPQTQTLYRISKSLGISMDMLLTEKLNKKQLPQIFSFKVYREEEKRIKRYLCGKVSEGCQESFKLYYLNTDLSGNRELIHEGELQVLAKSENEESEYFVTADFGLNIKHTKKKHYEGDISISAYHVYMNLKATGITKERLLIVLYDQISDNSYKGGLGLLISISRGLKRAPCAQKIILSKNPFGQNEKEEILPQLLKCNGQISLLQITEEQDQEVYKMLPML